MWVVADGQANGVDRITVGSLARRPTLRFLVTLRVAEWLTNTATTPPARLAAVVARACLLHASVRLGFSIPVNVWGPGLALPHWGTLVVSGYARVGENVRIHTGVNIGGTSNRAPVVGPGCYLGPGAKLFGAIELGEGCIVGANAVVTDSYPARTVIAGVPARAIRQCRPGDRPDELHAYGV